ncbi:MAG TPA: S-layer homology domain-containing protein [Bacilli bacterium]|nr:S-layer homology domain-containing protein [Bacilli bacterium]
MKKITVALLTASLLTLSTANANVQAAGEETPAAQVKPSAVHYSDIDHHYAQQAILQMTKMGVLPLTGSDLYCPDDPVSTEELATWIHKLIPAQLSALSGQSGESIARIHAAEWLQETTEQAKLTSTLLAVSYKDTEGISDQEQHALSGLFNQRIMIGIGEGRFAPHAPLTRGQAALVLSRLTAALNKTAEKITTATADLDGDGKEDDTVATLGQANGDDPLRAGGFLGFFNESGQLIRSFKLNGEQALFSTLHAQDLTGDGRPEIVLDTDFHGNGGRGAHGITVYTSDLDYEAQNLVLPSERTHFAIDYTQANKTYTITSPDNDHQWDVHLVGEQWKEYDPTVWMQKPYVSTIDAPYTVDLTDGLTTKHWFWTGSHVNGIAIYDQMWSFANGTWAPISYGLEATDPNSAPLVKK